MPKSTLTAPANSWKTISAKPTGHDLTFAHLGWVDLGGQTWTVRAHLDAARYAKYDRELAARPALIGTPDEQIISYPVQDRADATTRLLLHALTFLAHRFPHLAGPINWQPHTLDSGHTIHDATIARIEDHTSLVPVVARFDQALVDLADGDVRDMVVLIGEGFTRQLIIPVDSMEHTANEVFHRLAANGSLC